MLKLWRKQRNPPLLSIQGPFWPEVVAPDKVLSMGQIELFDIQTKCKQMTYGKLNY